MKQAERSDKGTTEDKKQGQGETGTPAEKQTANNQDGKDSQPNPAGKADEKQEDKTGNADGANRDHEAHAGKTLDNPRPANGEQDAKPHPLPGNTPDKNVRTPWQGQPPPQPERAANKDTQNQEGTNTERPMDTRSTEGVKQLEQLKHGTRPDPRQATASEQAPVRMDETTHRAGPGIPDALAKELMDRAEADPGQVLRRQFEVEERRELEQNSGRLTEIRPW